MTEREQLFIDFGRLKLAADGSDSYINGAVQVARSLEDRYFYLAAFTTFYAPPAQDAFCQRWSRRDLLERPTEVHDWILRHWRELPLSGARRTGAFTPLKVFTALEGAARDLTHANVYRAGETGNFDVALKELLKLVPYHGRYTGLKLYEALRRVGAPLPTVSHIVPRDGRTPRKGLDYIYGHDYHSNTPASLMEANTLADRLRCELRTTWFNVEMLLCNFTKAVKGSYYPGHALDRDLGRVRAVEAAFGVNAVIPLLEGRAQLYPGACLGEYQGWEGTRKECERWYPERGEFWSDLRANYRTGERQYLPLVPVRGYGEELV